MEFVIKSHSFLSFFAILLIGYTLLNYYVARRLAAILSLSNYQNVFIWIFVLLGLLSVLSMRFRLFLMSNGTAGEIISFCVYAWMGVILIAFFCFLCSDIFSFALHKFNIFRYDSIIKYSTLTLTVTLIAYAFYGGYKIPSIIKNDIASSLIPKELNGYKIVQLSDLHLDEPRKIKRLKKILNKVKEISPDLILISGDFVDRGLVCSEEINGLFDSLKPKDGIYGVFGNHEYYYGHGISEGCYDRVGIHAINNKIVEKSLFTLIGFGDIKTERTTKDKIESLLKTPKGRIKIVISHQPLFYEVMADNGVILTVSGHTHRGQIFPFHIASKLANPYFYGLYKIKASFFYVTSGAGTWGPQMRLFADPEIPVFTLYSQEK